MTYLERVLNYLTDELVTIDDIIIGVGAGKCKMTYIIDALKKGISNEQIRMVVNPNVKNKYQGHLYAKID